MALIEPGRRALAGGLPAAAPQTRSVPAQAVAFDGQAGFWHAAAGDVAVVLCPPIGREARCAYLPLRRFAERLAEQGYSTLRFDYPGEGESLDAPEEGDAFARWVDGAHAAVAFARAAGARKVVLAGVRMGGAVAAVAAQENLALDALMLLAPVVSGRGWVRELKLAASMATAAFRTPEGPWLISDDLRLSPDTVARVGALDLRKLECTAPIVLLRAQSPAVAALADPLRALGAEVAAGDFPGYDALFEEPHSNVPPHALFGEAIAWLQATVPSRARKSKPAAFAYALDGEGWRERPVRFGPGLVGVICEPKGAARRDAVVFVSTGGDPRAGLGRFPVTAARSLAADGIASLRFDFAGVGDSPAVEGDRSHVFETPRQADIIAALDLMQAQGFGTMTLVGICAGAYHALRAAAADLRIAGLFAVSVQKFVWTPGDSLAVGKRDDAGATQTYVEGLRSLATWKRLLRGDVQVGRILRSLSGRFVARLAAPANPEGARVRRMVADLSDRGVRARFLLGVHDAALDEMERWFGSGGRLLTALPGMSVRVAPRLDHGLSYQESRDIALADLRAFLEPGSGS